MKILVIGHLCLDVIHPENGEKTESYGGIYYPLITLASILGANDSVIPVFGVNRKDYAPLIDHLKKFPNIDPSGIFRFEEPTNRVTLFYNKDASRKERSIDIARPIPYQKIRRHLSVDGIIVNMISGFDITLDTLDHIRMAVRPRKIPLHFDFHSLTLGVANDHGRFRRPVEDWRRWGFMVDSVQMNQDEINGLSEEQLSEREAAGHLLTLSVRSVVITKGDAGATVYYNEKKKLASKDIPGVAVKTVRDITGCGDIFGAAFLVAYIRSGDPTQAATAANRIAAARVSEVGSDNLSENIVAAMKKKSEEGEAA